MPRKIPIQYTCEYCGKTFLSLDKRANRPRRFCNKTCAVKARPKPLPRPRKRITRQCAYCNRTITVKPSQLRERNYCSREHFQLHNQELIASGERKPTRQYTDEQVLSTIRNIAQELGHPPTQWEMNHLAPISASACQDHFGSWSKALELAGFKLIRPGMFKVSKDSKRQIIADDLREVYNALGHAPRLTEYERLGHYSSQPIYNLFNSYDEACQLAGFRAPPMNSNREPRTLDPNIVLSDIRHITEMLGHIPTFTEYMTHGRHQIKTICLLFGSYQSARIQCGFDPSEDNWNISNVLPEDAHWLSGLIEGEGCFMVKPRHPGGNSEFQCTFLVGQRNDRVDAIYEAARILGLDHSDVKERISNGPDKAKEYLPNATLTVIRLKTHALRIIPLFERFPLRGKKRDDFMLYRAAVKILWHKNSTGGKRRLTDKERFALSTLSKMLTLVKKNNVTLLRIKDYFGA